MKKTNTVVLAIALTVMLILLRDFLDIDMPFFVYSLVCAFSAVLLDSCGRFLYIVALLPFCRGIPYSEMIVITLLAEMVLVLLPSKRIRQLRVYLPLLAICAIELLDYLFFDVASIEILYLLAYMIFTSYAITNRVYEGQEEKYVLCYGISTIVAVLCVIIRSVIRYGWEYIFVYNYRFGVISAGEVATNFNANELGLYCAMATALFLTVYDQNKKNRYIFLAGVVSLLGLTSVSRTYILVLLGTWGLYALIGRVRVKQMLSIFGILVSMLILVVLLFPDVTEWLADYFASRFEEPNTRSIVMNTYFDIWLPNIWAVILGFSQNYRSAIGNMNLHAVHNGMQEVLICWGIVGFLMFFIWVWYLYRAGTGCRQGRRRIFFLSTVVFWVYIQTLQLVTMHNYITVMLLTAIPLRMGVPHEK